MTKIRQKTYNCSERIGVHISNCPFNKSVRQVKFAEKMDFESVWHAEHYGELRDPFITLAAMASATSKIKLATGVVGPYVRHPAILAFTFGTLDELSHGRMIMGIGAGNLTRMKEKLNMEGKNPLTHVKESVEIIQHLLTGKSVNYKGNIFSVYDLSLGFSPVRTKIPVYIGATREHMLRLTARIGDGVLFSAATSPNYVKWAVQVMREEAKKIEKDFNKIDIACIISCCVSEDYDLARRAVKPGIMSFLARPVRGEFIMEKAGLKTELLVPIRKALQSGDKIEAEKFVSDEIIDNLSIAGTRDECIKRLEKWRAMGVKLPVIGPRGNYEETIKALAP